MTLLLDGQKVQGKRMKVTANLRIEAEDMSGQTSGTEKAHKGFKPKTLTVSLMIPYKDKANLRDLMRLAEATAGGGELKTYRVVNDTAEAFGIRQVQFAEGVSAREDDTLAQWVVQFTLSEKLSNPERVESRRKANGTTAQSAPGQAVGSGAGGGGSDGSGSDQGLTGFESVLKRVDDYIGGTP
ncbi:DNA-binding protein [Pseudomonas sp. GZD-209]|uniref:baseplate complex protein n=1 Tax=Pseudomonas sp. GZD-209 TaxID=3404807 RepID=UPI003BB6BD19